MSRHVISTKRKKNILKEEASSFLGFSGSAEIIVVIFLVSAIPLFVVFILIAFSNEEVPKIDAMGWPIQKSRVRLKDAIGKEGFHRVLRAFDISPIMASDAKESIQDSENKANYGALSSVDEKTEVEMQPLNKTENAHKDCCYTLHV
eukprot:CAMPEP_0113322458 /NCGR_PEP_ID=MMETSP0010_2-20120614/15627_1 /TAXON_ID=216773 ORGANISM="Corethron hystrix, Strain 308" /NCGR_SAMPLE_ID=MMETSP0010_2 /ASSEMBLY_ACC=CAM_ASM_000155 /LENGTH=146 /DNA_ID=CAMNT_0000180981 /DNA_START=57 /DNA_END=497 /DNA_ORIENTATION=+ /assembly_acc=CAM_ASM_000155